MVSQRKPPSPSPAPPVGIPDKYHAILAAACHCFVEQGFSATRISDIARHAGIGKGTVYEYVRSKEDLLLDACLWSCDRSAEQMRLGPNDAIPVVDAQGQPLRSVPGHPVRGCYEVLRAVLQTLLRQNDNRMFSELQSVCRQRPDLLARTRERFGAKLSDWIETAFQLGKQGMAAGFFHDISDSDYRWCARLIVAAVDGLIWQRCFLPEEDLEQTAAHIAAAWIRLHLKQPELLHHYLKA